MGTFEFAKKGLKMHIPNEAKQDRDIGIIEFNMRLLYIVISDHSSIVQRINFCNIVYNNLIEFLKTRECVTEFNTDQPSPQLFALINWVETLNQAIGIVNICMQGLNRTISHNIQTTEIAIQNSANQYVYTGESIQTYLKRIEAYQEMNDLFTFNIKFCDVSDLEPMVVFTSDVQEIRISNRLHNLNLDYIPAYKLDEKYTRHSYLTELRDNTILFRNPYDSYEMVLDFFKEVASDPSIATIMISLYRVAPNSAIIAALKSAAKNGKRVYVYLEVNARGNELENIQLYRELSDVGVAGGIYVNCRYYGYKVHAKCCVAIAHDGTVYYHCGTGNYNEKTAKVYVDWQYFGSSISSPESFDRAVQLRTLLYQLIFESPYHNEELYPPDYNYINLLACIHKMTFKAPGKIRIKCNNLTDPRIIEALISAADAGCSIQLLIRTAIPNINHPNIEIKSLIGDYLEHERLYIFGDTSNPDQCDPIAIIGSSDLMFRNLSKRIEFLSPVDNTDIPILEETFNSDWNSDQ